MSWGIRKPSLKKSIAARTSIKRYVRHGLGLKAPREWGRLTNPKRAAYNRSMFGLGGQRAHDQSIVSISVAVANWRSPPHVSRRRLFGVAPSPKQVPPLQVFAYLRPANHVEDRVLWLFRAASDE